MSQGEYRENEVFDDRTDLSWDPSEEVPSFYNSSVDSFEQEEQPVSRGRLNTSTYERILDGLSVIGARFPILRSPDSPYRSLEADSDLSILVPSRLLESVEDEIDFTDCEEERIAMPTRAVAEMTAVMNARVDRFNILAINCPQGECVKGKRR